MVAFWAKTYPSARRSRLLELISFSDTVRALGLSWAYLIDTNAGLDSDVDGDERSQAAHSPHPGLQRLPMLVCGVR
jgi:hypothetical protein